ncbi:MAG: carboxyl transferase domain-containing protein [Rhodocyclaceae bacterium]|nr:carboxyl transferase domain-containing protein [Rhodocyclaceae bacterium]
MASIETNISPTSEAFQTNRQTMLALLERVREYERRSAETSARSRQKFEQRGQLLPRERLAILLDRGKPFLELCSIAGLGLDNSDLTMSVPGGGIIGGIGHVSGVRCMIMVTDSGIDAGALQPMGLNKVLRMQEIALENKLPYLQLVESAGANLMAYRVEEFVAGGNQFRNMSHISAAGLPIVTVTHGSSTAGGAYRTGLSDYTIMVRGRTRAFLAGPPLLMAATGEVATEEELGGALMHTTISGLGDYLAEDDRDAIRIARELLDAIDWNGQLPVMPTPTIEPPRFDAEELLGLMPVDHRRPVDMREIIARIADGSEFLEFSAGYGPGTVVGHIKLSGFPLGIVTNNGPLDPDGAAKATHFIQACCQSGTPLLYMHNTTGFVVGREYEEAGSIKHGAKMLQAVANATVPQVTLYCGASFGAGNYAMCGRGLHPNFCFSWPNAKTAVMGGEQAARTMSIVAEASMKRKGHVDRAKLDAMEQRIIEHYARQVDVFTTSAHLLDDGVIDPRDTRAVLTEAFSICRNAKLRQLQPIQFGVSRP